MAHLDLRPSLTASLDRLIAALAAWAPLVPLDSTRIIVVALAAHGTSVASVRPLGDVARSVKVAGARKAIELGLRPRFFLTGDAPRRIATLAHELLHLDARRPGMLREDKRHQHLPHEALEREARALARAFIATSDPLLLLPLAHHGEVWMRHWSARPVTSTKARTFTDKDVHEAPLVIHTPVTSRGGWW